MTDKYRTLDDVTKDAEKEKREKFKEMLVKDITDVKEKVFPKKTRRKISLLKWMGVLFLFLLLTTMILGCVFLLKIFVQGIF